MEKDEQIAKKYLGKVEDLMTEFFTETLDEKERKTIEDKVRKILIESGTPVTTATLRALYEGMKLMLSATSKDERLPMLLIMSVRSILKIKEKDTKEKADAAMESLEKK